MKPTTVASRIAVVLILVSSCTQKIDFNLAPIKPKLVVNAVLGPDEASSISVTKSRGSLDYRTNRFTNKDYIVPDATVSLREEGTGKTYKLTYSNNTKSYSSSYRVVNNEKYTLSVSTPGFETVTSTVIIPSTIPVRITKVVRAARMVVDDRLLDDIYVTFQDPPNEKNFYYFEIEKILENSFGRSISSGCIYANDLEIIKANGTDILSAYPCLQSVNLRLPDEVFNGKKREIVFSIKSETNKSSGEEKFVVKLFNVTEDYYKSLLFDSRSKDYLVLSDPVRPYTNIINGYGVLAGIGVGIDTAR